MSGWFLVVIFNAVTAAAYLGIAAFIVRGLRWTRQLPANRLAVATAAIFVTCAAHHLLHSVNLVWGSDTENLSMMREAMGGSLDVVVTAGTAIVGVAYLGLRRSYGLLVRSPAMFDDASEARYRQLAANLPHTVVFVMDPDLRFVLAEGAGLEEAGYGPQRLEGQLLRDAVPPEAFAVMEPHYRRALAGGESEFDMPAEVTGKTFRVRASPMRDGSDLVVGALVLAEDVTDERRSKAELDRARAFSDAVLTASPDITTITDVRTGTLTWASRSLRTLVDDPVRDDLRPWSQADSTTGIDDPQDTVVLAEDVAVVRAADREAASLAEGQSVTTRYRVLDGEGRTRWLSRRTTPFRRDPEGEVVEVLSVVREVTDVVETERALERAALHDPLTGLPNRMLLLDRIGSAIDRGQRTGATPAVLFCDLDGFKHVNDTGGHAAGDAVLAEVARRLRSAVRTGDSIARVGGDEFVVVVEAMVTGVETGSGVGAPVAESVAERIRAVLTTPIDHQGRQYRVSASIGMVLVERGSTAQDALRDADSAMYRAKQRGKNRIELFDAR